MKIRLSSLLGRIELKNFKRLENGVLNSYSWSITYDYYGEEISRTETVLMTNFGFKNRPMTEKDLNEVGVEYEKSSG